MVPADPLDFRVEKTRTRAILTLTTGASIAGSFFVSRSGPTAAAPERVADLLNSERGFFPFEMSGADPPVTVLYNRDQLATVEVAEDEARRDSGYALATARTVSMRLADGRELVGSVRIYRPRGRDRLSDWARDPARFRYLETDGATLIVNVDQIVSVREVPGP